MKVLTARLLTRIGGGVSCNGSGNSRGAAATCSGTVWQGRHGKVEASAAANTRQGVTGGGVRYRHEF